MPCFKYPVVFLSLLAIASLNLTSEGAVPTYSAHYCSNSTFFTANGIFESNLNSVLPSLSSNATRAGTGFYNASAGEDPPDVVYGFSLCRGDVSNAICQNCVAAATKEILRRCPLDKVSIIWYDECFLRYSNQSFFATADEVPVFSLSNNTGNIQVADSERFNQLLGTTMNLLATRASNSQSGKKFATEEEEFNSLQTLYSLVQCTPDLAVSDCFKCLQIAISSLPSCCGGKQGARVLLPSCILRYDFYPFYNIRTAASPTLPPLAPGKEGNSSRTTIFIVVSVVVSAVLILCVSCFYLSYLRVKKPRDKLESVDEISSADSLQFDIETIKVATHNFSAENKLGQGGFGIVYKGELPNGQEIAVKRLSKAFQQGDLDFKNEVKLVATLHHRNLVRLLGFCLEGKERLLVYEFVPNASLEKFIFGPKKSALLKWETRHKIIEGIARGLLYLHEDSRLCIIHRDLKASNILLDANMNPKISDFGTARLFVPDQTQGNTSRIVGTYGYMPPEYVMHGKFSVKSDVFSFGVLILEIVSGKKTNSHFQGENEAGGLLSYAWKNWREGTTSNLVDATLKAWSKTRIMRCIHIGLLCVQENVANRPTMATVILMFNSHSITLPMPTKPPFLMHSTRSDLSPQSENGVGVKTPYHRRRSSYVQASINEASISELDGR